MPRIIKAHQLPGPLPPWRPQAPGLLPRGGSPSAPLAGRPAGESPAPPSDLGALRQAARDTGLAQGMRAAETSYRAKLSRLDAMAAALREERSQFFDRVEPELVRLSVAIAEKIIGRELELRPDTVVGLVCSAMKRLRDREALRLSVNPRDLDQVKQARSDLIGAVDGVRQLDIVEDRRVDPGGCLIESPNGTLDARVRTQLEEIGRVLAEAAPSAEDADASPADPALLDQRGPGESQPHAADPEPAD